ncbi:MAG TPA: SET domain-containing protein [Chlamydiales bacterium]|nr:SET domain-containing protein [Chlamydiales bacterium]
MFGLYDLFSFKKTPLEMHLMDHDCDKMQSVYGHYSRVSFYDIGSLKEVLLHLKPFQKLFPRRQRIFIKENENMQSLTIAEFEKFFDIRFVSSLTFENYPLLKSVYFRMQGALKNGLLYEEQMWEGSLHDTQLSVPSYEDVFIGFAGKEKGWGLFAKNSLKKGAFVGEYAGLLRKRKKALDRYNAYLFEYSYPEGKRTPWTIDALEMGNLTRFINHSMNPNLKPLIVYNRGFMKIVFIANRDISPSEELTYDYGENYWKKRNPPIDG